MNGERIKTVLVPGSCTIQGNGLTAVRLGYTGSKRGVYTESQATGCSRYPLSRDQQPETAEGVQSGMRDSAPQLVNQGQSVNNS